MRIVLNFTSYIINGKSEISVNNYLQRTSYRKYVCNQNVKVIYLYGFPFQLSCTFEGGSGGKSRKRRQKMIHDQKLNKRKY